MRGSRHAIFGVVVFACLAALYAPESAAIRFDMDRFGGISGTLNTSFSLGGQWRIQERDPRLIGKANLDPDVCPSACQPHASTAAGDVPGRAQLGLKAEGNRVNQIGLDAAGAGSVNNDDGNLNFDRFEMTQAVVQINQDLQLEFGDVGFISGLTFFGRYNAFHDFVNYNRKIYHPNSYTAEDRARDDACRDADPGTPCVYGDSPTTPSFGFPTVGTPRMEEPGDRYNELLGQDLDILDLYVSGFVPLPFLDGEAKLTIGEQTINWGESTLLVVNSLNTINPPNVNALFRPAFLQLATVFEPVGAVRLSAPLTMNTSFEAFYQYDWEKVEIPPRGGFLSYIDATLGADENILNPGFGQVGDDREGNARLEQQLLTAVANVAGDIPLHEKDAPDGGQYGFAYTWFVPDFNNGTEFRFYYANYHSRLPYFSAYAGNESCLQAAPTGSSAIDTQNLLNSCPNADFAHFLGAVGEKAGGPTGAQAGTALGEALNAANLDQVIGHNGAGAPCPAAAAAGTGPCAELYDLDSFEGLLEYPEDIRLYGISFNTSFGDVSVQGEVAYRPNLPLQVDDVDVVFAAAQPLAPLGCSKQNRGSNCRPGSYDERYVIGVPALGDLLQAMASGGDSVALLGDMLGLDTGAAQDVVDNLSASLAAAGLDPAALATQFDALGLPDNVMLSDPPGRRVAFPDYLTAYRGQETGAIEPGQYIQGYERFQVLQYNLGGTYVIGPGNWVKSDQVILFFEVGATHVLGFPERDELQIEGPGTFYHASVGNDGSGAPPCPDDQKPQGTADQPSGNTTLCGPFQARFNPTQQRDGFATAFSWGWRIIGIVRYENVLPGISFEPVFVIAHDVDGTAPGPGENFLEGRQMYVLNVEMRYRQNWSVTVGATIFRGAKPYNQLADRDFFQLGIRYRF